MTCYEIVTEYGSFTVQAQNYTITDGGVAMFKVTNGGYKVTIASVSGNFFVRTLDGVNDL